MGIRATSNHLADLLMDDLTVDNAQLRDKVADTLGKLAGDGVLMRVDNEYRLQTRQGAEWDRDLRNRQSRLNNETGAVQIQRDKLLYGMIEKIVRGLRMVQSESKEVGQLAVHRGAPPSHAASNTTIPVWVRDGWETSEKAAVEVARLSGADDPTIHIFVPRWSADEIRRLVIEAEPARQTLDDRGTPTEADGQQARCSMVSRCVWAETARDILVRDIVAGAKVFQGGGTEVISATLEDCLREIANDLLVRLFPRFKEANDAGWSKAIKRARDAADNPLQPVGHVDKIEEHPACRQVVSEIGTGASGALVRKTLPMPPFGWPRDAVDAALIALHRFQHLSVTLNGEVVPFGSLDRNRVAKAEFQVERATLPVKDCQVIRKVFQTVGVTCKGARKVTGRTISFTQSPNSLNPLAENLRFLPCRI